MNHWDWGTYVSLLFQLLSLGDYQAVGPTTFSSCETCEVQECTQHAVGDARLRPRCRHLANLTQHTYRL